MDDSPRWKKNVRALLDTFHGATFSGVGRRVLDEGDLLRAQIEFANTGSLRALGMQVSGIPFPNGPTGDEGHKARSDRTTREHFAPERQQFQVDLSAIVQRNAGADLKARARGAPIIRFEQPQGGDHFVVLELADALNYGLKLLLRHRKYGADLHRCQWEKCEKFFFSSDAERLKKHSTGKPRTKYCSDECMLKKRDQKRRKGNKE
jgi:hypothetical protein